MEPGASFGPSLKPMKINASSLSPESRQKVLHTALTVLQ
jgi:hypothetical protein